MSRWILDTDHVSLFLEGNRKVITKVSQISFVAITIITVQEIFNGWMGKLNDPSQAENLVIVYTKLWETTDYFKSVVILNFDETANACYERLLKQHPKLNKKRLQKDFRIAAIALSTNSIMVTRNYKDFSQVPNLRIEDWTV
ncbi:nuclease [Nostoc sp. T09]|uniref:type II toxin-antitoxin system VapC family toxin n=1 Tax=Nostoc sp. T09 TaxID=1932621 RepID=UPI000A3B2F1D|nr:type II toxin-antitoxin system VapC family toxin [Nostoc sp. T09]OUL29421.1 nuclease [Nostoc sp. T09]